MKNKFHLNLKEMFWLWMICKTLWVGSFIEKRIGTELVDIEKLIEEQGLTSFPVGLGGCRVSGINTDSCDYDVFVFDDKIGQEIIKFKLSISIEKSWSVNLSDCKILKI